jgi:transcriptional antiterminator RfaH
MDTAKHWYVVHTKPNKEWVTRDNLQRQGYEFYLPLARQARRHQGRRLDSVEPLFPRYLFIRLAAGQDNFGPVRHTKGVQDLVRFSAQPAVVPDPVIDSLRRTADPETGLHDLAEPALASGQSVVIDGGPLAGLRGIFLAATAEDRVMVLLGLLGRESRVIVERDLLRSA